MTEARRDAVSTGLVVAAVLLLVLALAVPSFAPSRTIDDGAVEIVRDVRRNLAPVAAWLCGAAVVLAFVALLVRGADDAAGYVALGVVVLLACCLMALLPGVRECWGASHLSGPFEDDYSCYHLEAG